MTAVRRRSDRRKGKTTMVREAIRADVKRDGRMMSLVRIEGPTQIERGDHVYEPVRYGIGEDCIKWNEYVVEDIKRAAAVVTRIDKQGRKTTTATRMFKDLMVPCDLDETDDIVQRPFTGDVMIKLSKSFARSQSQTPPIVAEPPPPPPPDPAPAPAPAHHADLASFSAWLDMGKELFEQMAQQARDQVQRERDDLVADHQRQDGDRARAIAEMRAQLDELVAARDVANREHRDSLAAIDKRLAAATQRSASFQKLLAAVDGAGGDGRAV